MSRLTAFVFALAILLSACDDQTPPTREVRPNDIPEELKDCKFYLVDGHLRITRCPHSTTTTRSGGGKYGRETVTD